MSNEVWAAVMVIVWLLAFASCNHEIIAGNHRNRNGQRRNGHD